MVAVPVLVNVRHRSALAVIRASPKNKNLVVKRVVLLHEGRESKKLMFYMIFSPEKIEIFILISSIDSVPACQILR